MVVQRKDSTSAMASKSTVPPKPNAQSSTKTNLLALEGLRSLNKFFLYTSIAILIGILVSLISVGMLSVTASVLNNPLVATQSAGYSILGLAAILFIAMIALLVFGIYAVLSLMLGIRDIRRSSLASAPVYASISKWLKYLVIIYVILSAIYLILVMVNFLTSISLSLTSSNANPTSAYSGIGGIITVFGVIFIILELLFVWKLSSMYKSLAPDIGQPGLNAASRLLAVGIVIYIIGGVIGLVGGVSTLSSLNAASELLSGAGTAMMWSIVAIIVDLVALIVLFISQWIGYKSTKSALRN